jgi:large subunit ribosomal protein L22
MLPAGLAGHARLRYLGTSAQKARLVVDLIRGKQVEEALATLRFTNKVVAVEIGRVLDSALANARLRKPEVDVDRLFVKTAFVDGGPSLKRIRPAPMGRAFRVQKRMCHVTVGLGERPLPRPQAARRAPSGAEGGAKGQRTGGHGRPSGPGEGASG